MNQLSHDFLSYGEESDRISRWAADAYNVIVDMIHQGQLGEFMAEEIRDQVGAVVGVPDEPRHWGVVFARLKRENLIELKGYWPSKSLQAHRRPTARWRVL